MGLGVSLKGTSTEDVKGVEAFLAQIPHIDFPSWSGTKKADLAVTSSLLNLQATVPLSHCPQTVTTRFTGRATLGMFVCKCVCVNSSLTKCPLSIKASFPFSAGISIDFMVCNATVTWVIALTSE